jgi:DNA mismatch endonuclease (patch repair protein)
MADNLSPERRSWNMSRIRNKDTKPETAVRQYLFSKGFRFRKNDKRYPGKPDVVLPKYRSVIFVHGCFWHHHEGCKNATTPKSNTEFWLQKFARNQANDKKHEEQLVQQGWNVITLWECELEKDFEGTMEKVIKNLQDNLKKQTGSF